MFFVSADSFLLQVAAVRKKLFVIMEVEQLNICTFVSLILMMILILMMMMILILILILTIAMMIMIALDAQALNWKPHSDGWLGGLKMPGDFMHIRESLKNTDKC